MAEQTFSVAEAAEILGCSPGAVRRRIHSGDLDAFAQHGTWRVLSSGVQTPAADGQRQSASAPTLASRLAGRPWLLSPDDIAAVIGWPEDQVRYYLRRGELPGRKVGARWVCPQDALAAWCERGAAA